MATNTRQNLSWQAIDVATLPPRVAKLYDGFRKAQDAAKKAIEKPQTELETALTEALINSKVVTRNDVVKFGYRFDKLAMAIAEPSTAASTKPAIKLTA